MCYLPITYFANFITKKTKEKYWYVVLKEFL